MSKSQKQPYVRFFASDWLGGTRGMKAAEVGVYITLIAMMYERCEPLPEDHKRLARQCGCAVSTFVGILEMLVEDGKVTRDGAGLWNNRVEKEFKWRSKNSQQSSEAAHARWEKSKENNGEEMQAQCERNASGMPNQKPETRNQNKQPQPPDGFEAWYAEYPKKVGKGQARAKYHAACKKISPDKLLEAVKKFAASQVGKDPKFIPHPATWLNGERWADEDPPPIAEQKQQPKYGEIARRYATA